jgi:hypothetical protein
MHSECYSIWPFWVWKINFFKMFLFKFSIQNKRINWKPILKICDNQCVTLSSRYKSNIEIEGSTHLLSMNEGNNSCWQSNWIHPLNVKAAFNKKSLRIGDFETDILAKERYFVNLNDFLIRLSIDFFFKTALRWKSFQNIIVLYGFQ